MDLTTLAPATVVGSAAFVWLWRIAKRHLRFSMDLHLRVRTDGEQGASLRLGTGDKPGRSVRHRKRALS